MRDFILKGSEAFNNIYNVYNEDIISGKNVNKRNIIIMSLIYAICIMIGPIVVLINCFIFNDYISLVLAGLILCLWLIYYLTRIFYFLGLSKGRVKNIGYFFLKDGIAVLLMYLISVFIFLFI